VIKLRLPDFIRRIMKLKLRPSGKKSGSKSPTSATRRGLAKQGAALEDGSFPTPNKDFLRRAVKSLGRTPPEKRAKVKAYLKRRAKALGATDMLKSGALSMTAEERHAIELAMTVASSSDGPRVTSQAGGSAAMKVAASKLGLSDKGTKVYGRLRKKGLKHGQAFALAKRVKDTDPK
jgi:hypothetical protein